MFSRRSFLWSGAALAGAAVGYPVIVEPRWFDLTNTTVRLPNAAGPAIRILHLSDFHASWVVPLSSIDTAIQAGLSSNPDLICVTGDFITSRYDFDAKPYADTLRRLSAARPTFAVLGNHDGGSWAKAHSGFHDHSVVKQLLEDAGITLLQNRSKTVQVRGRALQLVGVGDFWSEDIDPYRSFREVRSDAPVVLLSHNPDSKSALETFHWDLMLCGHTHGGQVIIPFDGPRYAPVEDKRFVAGLHGWEGRQIYTSRGVGNVGSVRFMCRPEVTVLDLV